MSAIKFTSFPLTNPPPNFVHHIVEVFVACESKISTEKLKSGLDSDHVMKVVGGGLEQIGFQVERSKKQQDKIARPVFYGENGAPALRYEIDAYHDEWRCGLEIEAGRATMGNAIFRDLFQAMVMVDVDYLVLAVPNVYRYKASGKPTTSLDYKKTIAVASALYGHTRTRMPYGLLVMGY